MQLHGQGSLQPGYAVFATPSRISWNLPSITSPALPQPWSLIVTWTGSDAATVRCSALPAYGPETPVRPTSSIWPAGTTAWLPPVNEAITGSVCVTPGASASTMRKLCTGSWRARPLGLVAERGVLVRSSEDSTPLSTVTP